MICPECKSTTTWVISTWGFHGRIRRRRRCAICGRQFSTEECLIRNPLRRGRPTAGGRNNLPLAANKAAKYNTLMANKITH